MQSRQGFLQARVSLGAHLLGASWKFLAKPVLDEQVLRWVCGSCSSTACVPPQGAGSAQQPKSFWSGGRRRFLCRAVTGEVEQLFGSWWLFLEKVY